VCNEMPLLGRRSNVVDKVETWYPRRREVPRNFLETVVGNTRRQRETKAAADVMASGNVDKDLLDALQVRLSSFVITQAF
jgi:DNA polymerase/3'-5' exonuclease PolX